MEVLKQLLSIRSLSGNEVSMRNFLIDYFEKNSFSFHSRPTLYSGDGFQDCLAIAFGNPKTAVFAHMDTIGFMVRYGKELTEIGQPHLEAGDILTGEDKNGPVECSLIVEEKEDASNLYYEFSRQLERGTELTFKYDFIESDEYIQSPYLDNRIGIWNCLQLAKTLENGLLIFSAYEEHSGGATSFMARFAFETFGIKQALISDVTWVTHGIHHGSGVVISMRDSGIPRRSYVNRIISIAENAGISFQIEIENTGGSDGNELQKTPYPIDWCFIGIAESNVHSPKETIHKSDLGEMLKLYEALMKNL